MISSLQSIYEFRQSSRGCSALFPNWRMTCFGLWDEFFMVSALVWMVTHWIEPTLNYDIKLLGYHDSLGHYITWTLNLEKILSLWWNQDDVLTYGRDPNVMIYPYRLSHYWWRMVAINILNRDTMISHGIETICPYEWSKGHVFIKFVVIVIP